MGFDFNKIKNLFVETSTTTDATENEHKPITEAAKTDSPVSASPDKLDQTILESLLKAMTDHNLPGEDYLEFIDALKAMQNIPLDDAMKIQTVMAALSTKGLTVSKIRESADYYKKTLANEQNQFLAELNSQIEKGIKTKQKTIESFKESIKLKSEQIAALTKEINEIQQNISSTEVLIKASETKIKAAQDNFNKVYNFVVNQINENVSKLK